MAGPLPWHEDQRWQGPILGHEAIGQSSPSGIEDNSDEFVAQRLRAGRVLLPNDGRMAKPRANTATEHKLARMVYLMVTRDEEYVDQGQQRYGDQQRQRSMAAFLRRAAALGVWVSPTPRPHDRRLRFCFLRGRENECISRADAQKVGVNIKLNVRKSAQGLVLA